ncbi:patatin-related protein [Sphingorhabdus rigui]|uniref:Patatin-related protein n=1 Tax=Sphingorhabdus rigui TaxID=1282858 RepID=A0A840AYW0_9SPHN|nr:patatin-like protein [Sphingorhabdus rigui]MBB3943298.1 patatin-related protein [Sphingorhabdus rigui]
MREKELRLALICYGGVSLAIYMHGVTREIWHMVRASRAFHDAGPAARGSESVYHDLLAEISQVSGTKLRVLTDIIAGSSAGGINGIFLSQAIVTGQSLEPLTDMWLEMADVDVLLDPDARPLSRFSKFWATPIAWLILRRRGGAVEQTVAKEAQDEVATKLSRFVRARWFAPPFGGNVFSKLLLDALKAMAASKAGSPLLPVNQPLDLFVTVTDFNGHDRVLRLNSPPEVTESEHRITVDFSTRGRTDLADMAELIFAARATASFPGAFPPFSVRELDRLLARENVPWLGRNAFLKRILPQQFAANAAEDTMLIDGSVLANAPFNQAIAALRNRPARREVDRRFVYIDPKPGRPSFRFGRRNADGSVGNPRKPPGFFATIFGATSNIPREQPIRDSLEKISGRSERIERMRQVIDSLRNEVETTVEALLGKTWFLSQPTAVRMQKWRQSAQEKAILAAGFSYRAYGHLKLAGVVDDIVATARRSLPDANNGFFRDLRAALWSEIRTRGLDRMPQDGGKQASKQSIAFFGTHDLRFRIRRLRFLARHLTEEVENAIDVPEKDITQIRDAIYRCLAMYLDLETAEFLGVDFAIAAKAGVTNPAGLIDHLASQRDLVQTDLRVDAILCAALLALPVAARRAMLLGYLGYALYDIATLPLLQDEGFDEFDPVKVDRISPEDCNSIRKGGAATTLKGIEFNNFGAFFSRSYRENDYLWGRLHGAERLIDILVSSLPAGHDFAENRVRAYKRLAFHAILDEEQDRLKYVQPLIASLRNEIDQIEI